MLKYLAILTVLVAPCTLMAQKLATQEEEIRQQNTENLKLQRELTWFTGALVFVGAIQAGTVIWQGMLSRRTLRAIQLQAEEMKTQTAISTENAKAAERAFNFSAAAVRSAESAVVLLEGASLDMHGLLVNADARLMLQFRNFGRTLAKDVTVDYHFAVADRPIMRPKSNLSSTQSLGSGQTRVVTSQRIGNLFSDAELALAKNGTRTFVLWGTVGYTTLFDSLHVEQFTGSFDLGTGKFNIDLTS